MQPIFLQPVLQEKIWGGQKLHHQFGLQLPSNKVGEAWCISAHPHGVSQVTFPKQYAGLGLNELYEQAPQLFGSQHPTPFPLLIKILDAKEDLSVQVHPDDAYGLKHEGELGKTECWYIISADEDAKIIYGHQAQSKRQFLEMVKNGQWQDLLVEVPVKAGDFFDVPAGTIHAIGSGCVILETQQNSDTTYRVYDYDRLDDQGQPRELHIQQSADVTHYPSQTPTNHPTVSIQEGGSIIHYLTNDFFSVYKWQVSEQLAIHLTADYTLATVIAGEGILTVDNVDYPLHLADSFIIPHGIKEITIKGQIELITSNVE